MDLSTSGFRTLAYGPTMASATRRAEGCQWRGVSYRCAGAEWGRPSTQGRSTPDTLTIMHDVLSSTSTPCWQVRKTGCGIGGAGCWVYDCVSSPEVVSPITKTIKELQQIEIEPTQSFSFEIEIRFIDFQVKTIKT